MSEWVQRDHARRKHYLHAVLVRDSLEAMAMPDSEIGTEPHWACPDCGQPCSCQGGARLLTHEPCGKVEL